jgi:hypothetical protein
MTAAAFCLLTLGGSTVSSHLREIWYGLGLVLGAISGFAIAFFRLRWMERHLDRQVFCRGTIIPGGNGAMPSAMVYTRAARVSETGEERRDTESDERTPATV